MSAKVDRDYAKQIGQRIKKERKAHGMTLKDLGRAVGLSEQAISQYERGTRLINNETLKRIYDVLEHYEKPDAASGKVVVMGVYEQVRWERDVAISQLQELGIGLGQIMPDMVEVVRCKDCVHWEPEPMGTVMMCYEGALERWTEPDFFCACGKKAKPEG